MEFPCPFTVLSNKTGIRPVTRASYVRDVKAMERKYGAPFWSIVAAGPDAFIAARPSTKEAFSRIATVLSILKDVDHPERQTWLRAQYNLKKAIAKDPPAPARDESVPAIETTRERWAEGTKQRLCAELMATGLFRTSELQNLVFGPEVQTFDDAHNYCLYDLVDNPRRVRVSVGRNETKGKPREFDLPADVATMLFDSYKKTPRRYVLEGKHGGPMKLSNFVSKHNLGACTYQRKHAATQVADACKDSLEELTRQIEATIQPMVNQAQDMGHSMQVHNQRYTTEDIFLNLSGLMP